MRQHDFNFQLRRQSGFPARESNSRLQDSELRSCYRVPTLSQEALAFEGAARMAFAAFLPARTAPSKYPGQRSEASVPAQ